jgi:CRISPR-associated protein Cas5d
MFHGFDYPDETGEQKLYTRFWKPTMVDGVIRFIRPEEYTVRKFVHDMESKQFEAGKNLRSVSSEAEGLEV